MSTADRRATCKNAKAMGIEKREGGVGWGGGQSGGGGGGGQGSPVDYNSYFQLSRKDFKRK